MLLDDAVKAERSDNPTRLRFFLATDKFFLAVNYNLEGLLIAVTSLADKRVAAHVDAVFFLLNANRGVRYQLAVAFKDSQFGFGVSGVL